MGCDRIIMSDDDIYPKPDSDVNRLYEWHGFNTLGIGIMVPFYGLMFGNETIKNEDRPLMSKGALGKRLFSLNVQRVWQSATSTSRCTLAGATTSSSVKA
jgi:hypothetical protein